MQTVALENSDYYASATESAAADLVMMGEMPALICCLMQRKGGLLRRSYGATS